MKPFHKESMMRKSKLSPLEILHKQKTRLQKKSKALSDAIEINFNYLQRNSVSLLSDAIARSTLSSMPSFLRNLTANFGGKKQERNTKSSASRSLIIGIAAGCRYRGSDKNTFSPVL